MFPINILKTYIKLNSLASIFGDTAHIPGALKKVFNFNHLSKEVNEDPVNMFKGNNRISKKCCEICSVSTITSMSI